MSIISPGHKYNAPKWVFGHAWARTCRDFTGGTQTILGLDPAGAPRGAAEEATAIELMPIEPEDERALQSVKSIHTAYARGSGGGRDVSVQLRSFAVLPTFDDIGLTVDF